MRLKIISKPIKKIKNIREVILCIGPSKSKDLLPEVIKVLSLMSKMIVKISAENIAPTLFSKMAKAPGNKGSLIKCP
jgi:hypothetical protein